MEAATGIQAISLSFLFSVPIFLQAVAKLEKRLYTKQFVKKCRFRRLGSYNTAVDNQETEQKDEKKDQVSGDSPRETKFQRNDSADAKGDRKTSPSSYKKTQNGSTPKEKANGKNDASDKRQPDRNSAAKGTGTRFRTRRRTLDTRKITINYKKPEVLERFVSKTGKILPRRVTGATNLVQRKITREIKRARHIGLLPYTHR